MIWENVDPNVLSLITQLSHLQKQIVFNTPLDTTAFLPALVDFMNVVGKEIEEQGKEGIE